VTASGHIVIESLVMDLEIQIESPTKPNQDFNYRPHNDTLDSDPTFKKFRQEDSALIHRE